MKKYDTAIIGGGIVGASTLYMLSHYTNIKNIALFEKHDEVGQGVSNHKYNSQTLHQGGIQTHYTKEKAQKVRRISSLTIKYIEDKKDRGLYEPIHKMVIAVGDKEIKDLMEHWNRIKETHTEFEKIDKEKIAELEPSVVEGRDPEVPMAAIYSPHGHTVDYGKVTESLVKDSLDKNADISLELESEIRSVKRDGDGFIIKTTTGSVRAKTVLVATGTASLRFAHRLGYAKNWIVLPVAGNFYCTKRRFVNGKVYTVQDPKLPFSAVHADPSVRDTSKTQFGPLAKVLPMTEREDYSTFFDFLRLFRFKVAAFKSLASILSDFIYLKYIAKQFLYDLPIIGMRQFVHREARKIVPKAKTSDFSRKKVLGGIRPQIVDTNTKDVLLGDAKIEGNGIIFDITPSPGASVSLYNGYQNTKKIVEFMGEKAHFDEERFKKDFEVEGEIENL